MKKVDIEVGDDISISGTVRNVIVNAFSGEIHSIDLQLPSGRLVFIREDDIKTIRPNGRKHDKG